MFRLPFSLVCFSRAGRLRGLSTAIMARLPIVRGIALTIARTMRIIRTTAARCRGDTCKHKFANSGGLWGNCPYERVLDKAGLETIPDVFSSGRNYPRKGWVSRGDAALRRITVQRPAPSDKKESIYSLLVY